MPEKLLVLYKSLKQKQKARIADWMYRETLRFYLANQRMPEAEEAEHLCEIIYAKVCGGNYRISYEEVRQLYQKRLIAYESRIQKDAASGVTLESLEKKPKVKKTGKKPRPKKKRKAAQAHEEPWQDDRFFFIAGYTSGGAPYGVTWEEMGLRPWQELGDDDSLLDDI